MDTRLLTQLPTEQARCREIARDYITLGSIGCFAAALIEQALQRADRAIIDGGGEDALRGVLRELQAFDGARQVSAGPALPGRSAPASAPCTPIALQAARHRSGWVAHAGAL